MSLRKQIPFTVFRVNFTSLPLFIGNFIQSNTPTANIIGLILLLVLSLSVSFLAFSDSHNSIPLEIEYRPNCSLSGEKTE